MICYGLDKSKTLPPDSTPDEYFVKRSKSDFVAMSQVRIINKGFIAAFQKKEGKLKQM